MEGDQQNVPHERDEPTDTRVDAFIAARYPDPNTSDAVAARDLLRAFSKFSADGSAEGATAAVPDAIPEGEAVESGDESAYGSLDEAITALESSIDSGSPAAQAAKQKILDKLRSLPTDIRTGLDTLDETIATTFPDLARKDGTFDLDQLTKKLSQWNRQAGELGGEINELMHDLEVRLKMTQGRDTDDAIGLESANGLLRVLGITDAGDDLDEILSTHMKMALSEGALETDDGLAADLTRYDGQVFSSVIFSKRVPDAFTFTLDTKYSKLPPGFVVVVTGKRENGVFSFSEFAIRPGTVPTKEQYSAAGQEFASRKVNTLQVLQGLAEPSEPATSAPLQ